MFERDSMHVWKQNGGFTFVELLIVLTIISILIVFILEALDPLEKFARAQHARRLSDVETIAQAVKINQIDHDGKFTYPVSSAIPGRNYMISYALDMPESPECNKNCPQVHDAKSCLNFYNSDIITNEYLRYLPIAPVLNHEWSNEYTGYFINKSPHGVITVTFCEDDSVSEYR